MIDWSNRFGIDAIEFMSWQQQVKSKKRDSHNAQMIFSAILNAKTIQSIELIFDSHLQFQKFKNERVLEKMGDLKRIKLECDETGNIQHVKEALKILRENHPKSSYEIVLLNQKDKLVLLKEVSSSLSTSISSLSLEISLHSQDEVTKSLAGINALVSLSHLEIHLRNGGKEESRGETLLQTRFLKQWNIANKLKNLTSLSLGFSMFPTLSEKELVDVAKKIALNNQITTLSLDFEESKVSSKGFSDFLTTMSSSKISLKSFSFSAVIFINEASAVKALSQFFNSQVLLETLEINSVEIDKKCMKSYFEALGRLKELKGLHFDLQMNEIGVSGLEVIAENLKEKSSSLETLKIFFDKSVFSGSSVLSFGKTLASLKNLTDLRLEFPGKIKDDSIVEFAECITSCEALQYLYLNFSGSGSWNIVEKSSCFATSVVGQNEIQRSHTIFEADRIEVSQPIMPYKHNFKVGFFHSYVFDLAIANRNSTAQHLSIQFPCFENCPKNIETYIWKAKEDLMKSRRGLKSFKFNWFQFNQLDVNLIVGLLKENESTLLDFETQTQLTDEILNALKPISGRLLRLRSLNEKNEFVHNVSDSDEEDDEYKPGGFPALEIAGLFPNLIELDFIRGQYSDDEEEQYLYFNSQFVQSSLTYFYPKDQIRTTVEENRICKESINAKRSSLMSLIVFNRYVASLLIFQPKLMPVELWVDS